MSGGEAHDLSGAYVLDAVSEPERRRFERHADECESCAAEVSGLREAAARLGTAVAEAVPERLRGRVLAEISGVRQLPPRLGQQRRRRRPTSWGRFAAVAGFLLVSVALGGSLIQSQERLGDSERQDAAVRDVLSAPDASTAHATAADGGGTGVVVVSRARGQAVITLTGLPELPASRTYELWLLEPAAARPAGISGAGGRQLVADLTAEATGIGVTVEPAGGSPRPTTTPMLTVRLP